MKTVLLAGLFHETHTFVEGRTRVADFAVLRGEELLRAEGDASPLAGVLEVARESNWNVIPIIDMRATPSAMVEDAVVETWWREFEAGAAAALREGVDAIYLVLHGAMASENFPDVEGEILRRIRALSGADKVLCAGCTDLHANFSQAMATHSNALITYRRNPHTDAKETAVRAARLLDKCLNENLRPRTFFAHPPLMWPPTGTGTADEPMRILEQLARDIEEDEASVLAVNVHAGFSFADTPDTGVSFSIVTIGDETAARAHLERLSQTALEMREVGNIIEASIESVMPQVKLLLQQPESGPIILVEPSDNIGAGAPGDGTGILRALIEHKIENSAVVINDAEAVKVLCNRQIGERATLAIGGKGSALDAGPLTLELELVSTSDGQFELEDAHSHAASMGGMQMNMGPCAVVRHGGVWILLTSRKTAPMDLGQWRSQSLEPENFRVIGVKAAVAHRQAYDPIARASFWAGTTGPCSSDLKSFDWRLVKRPVFPLDV